MVIDETGGMHGVRDSHILSSLEDTPRQKIFGKELYPTLFLKAAVYARNNILFHPFIDGNKRTGMTVALVFLEYNGYKVVAKKGEIKTFALWIIKHKPELEVVAGWFKEHSRKIQK